jgi:hypothetical protein
MHVPRSGLNGFLLQSFDIIQAFIPLVVDHHLRLCMGMHPSTLAFLWLLLLQCLALILGFKSAN